MSDIECFPIFKYFQSKREAKRLTITLMQIGLKMEFLDHHGMGAVWQLPVPPHCFHGSGNGILSVIAFSEMKSSVTNIKVCPEGLYAKPVFLPSISHKMD